MKIYPFNGFKECPKCLCCLKYGSKTKERFCLGCKKHSKEHLHQICLNCKFRWLEQTDSQQKNLEKKNQTLKGFEAELQRMAVAYRNLPVPAKNRTISFRFAVYPLISAVVATLIIFLVRIFS